MHPFHTHILRTFRIACTFILLIAGYVNLQGQVSGPIAYEKNPGTKFQMLVDSCENMLLGSSQEGFGYARGAVVTAIGLKDDLKLALAYYYVGSFFEAGGDNDSAYHYLNLSRELFKKNKDNEGVFRSSQKIAQAYTDNADYHRAYTLYKELIDLAESSNDKDKLARVYIGIGEMFRKSNDPNKSISYNNKALEVAKKNELNDLIESCYLNLGVIYSDMKQIDFAVEYLNRALKMNVQTKDKRRKAKELNSMGSIYFDLADEDDPRSYEKALDYFKQTLEIYRELNYAKGFVMCNNNIGTTLLQLKKYNIAKPYLIEAYFTAKNSKGNVDGLLTSTFNLSQLYDAAGDYKSALQYMNEYTFLNDSLYNLENSKALAEVEAKYETEKKDQQNKLLLLSNAKKQQMIYFAAGVCVLLIGLVFFVFRGYSQKKKANIALAEKNGIIEEKSKIVEEQHKDITDSIKYAQRIQKAILPPDRMWQEILPDSFVFYQPKDILSGDFYWIAETADFVFVAAADCTGHGVPGALVSIVNYNLLGKAVLEKGITDPGAILDEVNKQLTQSLHQTYQESAVRDGMDISLCVIDRKTRMLHYAGAYNSIYIINSVRRDIKELLADKQPVGAFIEDNLKSFTTKTYPLSEEDVVYMFTDGYADQFGGEKGKKFKYKNLQELLVRQSAEPFASQKKVIDKTINDWKGPYEQVDDMLLLGFSIRKLIAP